MALLAVAAEKGSPGVTTSAVALAAVWPRPVLLAECDPAGGDLVFRLRGTDRGTLDTRRGLLSLAVAARRGVTSGQVWEHVQKVHGGLDILAGVTSAEQGAGLDALWGTIGAVLADLPQADVIADCGRIGVDGPFYDLLAQASMTLMISGASLGEVIRLRDRAAALSAGLLRRARPGARIHAAIIASPRYLSATLGEVGQALGQGSAVSLVGGIAHDPKSAESLRGEWGGKLDKSMLMRTAREIAAAIAGQLPAAVGQTTAAPQVTGQPVAGTAVPGRPAAAAAVPGRPAAAAAVPGQSAASAVPGRSATGAAVPGRPAAAAAAAAAPGRLASEVPLAAIPQPLAPPAPQPVAAPAPHPVAAPAQRPVAAPASHPVAPPASHPMAPPASHPVAPPVPHRVAPSAAVRAPVPAGQFVEPPAARGRHADSAGPPAELPDVPGEQLPEARRGDNVTAWPQTPEPAPDPWPGPAGEW